MSLGIPYFTFKDPENKEVVFLAHQKVKELVLGH